ncbi:YncE family protein [Tenacibaculum sp. TC6]|uniref:YncE family protein n=1 Tax=Tenacibaculum sp. TC6 TaxID=3423223 RepID=UPI003D366449
MKINKLLVTLFLGSILFTSCSDDSEPQTDIKGDYENGILISGEGTTSVSGSVSFVSNDYSRVVNTIYKKVNNLEFGEYVQSITFDKDRAYIVADNQNTITVVNRYTFEKVGAINTGLLKPRYMTIIGSKGYITNWGETSNDSDDFVAVADLNTFQVEKKINVILGPERIIAKEGKLYVSHQGAFGNNNKVVVINASTNTVEKEIEVKDRPDEIYVNDSGAIVVLSQGRTIYDTNWNVTGHTLAAISFINTNEGKVTSELVFKEGEHPSQMIINGNSIYYNLGNDIYKTDMNSTVLPTSKHLTAEASYLYGLAAKDNNLFVLDASFTGKSKLKVYDLGLKTKTIEKEVALGASKIYFN